MSLGIQHPCRITEHGLRAESSSNVPGTRTENPNPANEYDRNLIKQGENEKNFLMTTMTEKQAGKNLYRKALLLLILGAGLLAAAARA